MKWLSNLRPLAFVCALLFLVPSSTSQSLDIRWKKTFSQNISWYVRTSRNILLVKAGKSLTAIEGATGKQLWILNDLEHSGSAEFRGKNVLEIPGTEVLLVNHTKLPDDADEKLVALNQLTGERLWTMPPTDDLMAAVALQNSREFVLISRRLQKKVLAGQLALMAATGVPLFNYPFRFELQKLEIASGKAQWNVEYPRTFAGYAFSPQRATIAGDHLFLQLADSILAAVDLGSGTRLWERIDQKINKPGPPLSLQFVGGRVLMGPRVLHAFEETSGQSTWEIKDVGRVHGICIFDGILAVLGDKNLATADPQTGKELWRKKTYSHATNLLWDRTGDALVYLDGKGLHRVDRTTGRAILDTPLKSHTHPIRIRLASPDTLLTLSSSEVSVLELKTGKTLWERPVEGKSVTPP